ncbi:MAG: terminase large subunit domain-containing protein, partial [Persicimonas sp.]
MIVLKARQIGISSCLVLIALMTARSRPRHDVYLCSTSLTNAKDLLRRTRKWIEVFRRAGLKIPLVKDNVTELEFTNGSRIIAQAAKSVRSRSGTIILDEFGVYQHDREVWKAVAPAAEANPDLRIIAVSTPFGASGQFYDIWVDEDGIYSDWSRHEIDVYQAAAEGFPVDPEEMKQRYALDVWRQEFCCQFLSDIDQYFSYDLIRRSQYAPEEIEDTRGTQYGGLDLASERDASIFAGLLDNTDVRWLNLIETIKQAGVSRDYSDQIDDVREILDAHPFEVVAVDETGEGKDLTQRLTKAYSRRLIRGIDSQTWKDVHDVIPTMRHDMEVGELKLPNSAAVRNAFAKVQKKQLSNRRVKYDAVQDAEGHADEFFASALAYFAALEG